jgi:hypothetical protein
VGLRQTHGARVKLRLMFNFARIDQSVSKRLAYRQSGRS